MPAMDGDDVDGDVTGGGNAAKVRFLEEEEDVADDDDGAAPFLGAAIVPLLPFLPTEAAAALDASAVYSCSGISAKFSQWGNARKSRVKRTI